MPSTESNIDYAVMAVQAITALREYLEAHRLDIEDDINDFGDLKPVLVWHDASNGR